MSSVQIQNQLDALNNHNQTQDARINTFEGQVNTLDAKFTNVERKVNETDQLALDIDSKQKALEKQFNEAIQGEVEVSNAEVIEARGTFQSLSKRLEHSDQQSATNAAGITQVRETTQTHAQTLGQHNTRLEDWEQFKTNGGHIGGNLGLGLAVAGMSGHTTLPNGLILQWGTYEGNITYNGYTDQKVWFPRVFPNLCFNVQLSFRNADNGDLISKAITVRELGKWNDAFNFAAYHPNGYGSAGSVSWMAIGY